MLTGKSSILDLKMENIIYPQKGRLHGKNYDKLLDFVMSPSFAGNPSVQSLTNNDKLLDFRYQHLFFRKVCLVINDP